MALSAVADECAQVQHAFTAAIQSPHCNRMGVKKAFPERSLDRSMTFDSPPTIRVANHARGLGAS
jgi:hypothetical protein